jgi:hypothetical protein
MLNVSTLLADLDAMPGVALFKYANYLAPLQLPAHAQPAHAKPLVATPRLLAPPEDATTMVFDQVLSRIH